MDAHNKRMKEMPTSFTITQMLEMDCWFALIRSMRQSKTLTVMVIVGVLLFSGFLFFLFKMSGA